MLIFIWNSFWVVKSILAFSLCPFLKFKCSHVDEVCEFDVFFVAVSYIILWIICCKIFNPFKCRHWLGLSSAPLSDSISHFVYLSIYSGNRRKCWNDYCHCIIIKLQSLTLICMLDFIYFRCGKYDIMWPVKQSSRCEAGVMRKTDMERVLNM